MRVSCPTITVTASAYTALDCFGDGAGYRLQNVVNRESRFVILQSITVKDKGGQAPGLNMMFFDADPTNSTFTDSSVLSIHATDWDMCVGEYIFDDADWLTTDGLHRIKTEKSVGLQLPNTASGDLWVVFQTVGTPNPAATDDYKIDFNFIPSA